MQEITERRLKRREAYCDACKSRPHSTPLKCGIKLCPKCFKSIRIDAQSLSRQPRAVSSEVLGKWLDKYCETKYPLFINGRFNQLPETIVNSPELLGQIDFKEFE